MGKGKSKRGKLQHLGWGDEHDVDEQNQLDQDGGGPPAGSCDEDLASRATEDGDELKRSDGGGGRRRGRAEASRGRSSAKRI